MTTFEAGAWRRSQSRSRRSRMGSSLPNVVTRLYLAAAVAASRIPVPRFPYRIKIERRVP